MSMRVQLRDLAPGQDYALQFRSNNGDGGVSEWSQIQRFTTTNDTTRPGNVLNLSFVTSGSSYIARWDRTVLDEYGGPLRDFRHYRVQITDGTTTTEFLTVQERVEFTQQMNLAAFGTFKNDLTIKVWAVDLTYNESLTVAQQTASSSNPPVPSTPVVSPYLGLLQVVWDGKASDTTAMPNNFLFCEVHVSTTTSFTPTASTFVGRVYNDGTGNKWIISGLTYGTTYYVRLVAVNSLQKKSGPSAQATGVPSRISGLDIQNGQISVAQINFTAKDIGGANAFYSTSQPVSGMVNGDIWYDTDDGYKTYRYNGSTWALAPEIGVIAGTKILAGTLTADAVGTNLLITASANIANAIIDDAKITNLSAAKLTAGTMTAEIALAGRIATSLTGQRVEINSNGIFRYDSAGVQTVAIDSAGALLTGEYRSAATGRRITMGTSGDTGSLKFIGPDGTTTEFQSITASNGDEIARWGIDIPGSTWEYWNGLAVSSRQSITGYSRTVLFGFANTTTPTAANGSFIVSYLNDTSTPTGYQRLNITENSHTHIFTTAGSWGVYEQISTSPTTSVARMSLTSGGNFHYIDGGDVFGVLERNASVLSYRMHIAQTDVSFRWPDTDARVVIRPTTGFFGVSGQLQMVNYWNYGIQMFYAGNSDGTGGRLDIRDANASIYMPVWASAFVPSSSEVHKGDIRTYNEDAAGSIRGLTAKRFRRKKSTPLHDERKGPAPKASTELEPREEIGFIAEEVPAEFRVEGGDLGPGIDIVGILATNVRATQEILDRLDKIEARLNKLENKNNGGTNNG